MIVVVHPKHNCPPSQATTCANRKRLLKVALDENSKCSMSDVWHFKKETLQNKSEDAHGCRHPHQANSEVTQFIIQKKKGDGP